MKMDIKLLEEKCNRYAELEEKLSAELSKLEMVWYEMCTLFHGFTRYYISSEHKEVGYFVENRGGEYFVDRVRLDWDEFAKKVVEEVDKEVKELESKLQLVTVVMSAFNKILEEYENAEKIKEGETDDI